MVTIRLWWNCITKALLNWYVQGRGFEALGSQNYNTNIQNTPGSTSKRYRSQHTPLQPLDQNSLYECVRLGECTPPNLTNLLFTTRVIFTLIPMQRPMIVQNILYTIQDGVCLSLLSVIVFLQGMDYPVALEGEMQVSFIPLDLLICLTWEVRIPLKMEWESLTCPQSLWGMDELFTKTWVHP